MPCYRCGARQHDPARGGSAWRRGVREDEQVLVCPDCQLGADWAAELDRCPRCGSTALVRRLGRTACRDCEASQSGGMAAAVDRSSPLQADDAVRSDAARAGHGSGEEDSDLAREVAAAIDRILGRAP